MKKQNPKPYDMHWFLPNGKIVVIELKSCSNHSWNICKTSDSSSLKQHQLEYLEALFQLGHSAWVGINFNFNVSPRFKAQRTKSKCQDIYYGRKITTFSKAFLARIDFVLDMQRDDDKIALETFEEVSKEKKTVIELNKKKVNSDWCFDPENFIMQLNYDKNLK